MTKKQAFIDYVKGLFDEVDVPEDAREYWNALIADKSGEKPLFTENGKNVLKFLQKIHIKFHMVIINKNLVKHMLLKYKELLII